MTTTESFKNRIIKALIDSGKVDKKKIKRFLSENNEDDAGMVESLTKNGLVLEKDILSILSKELEIPPINLTHVTLDKEVISSIPEKLMRRHTVVPLSRLGDDLTLVVADPTAIVAIDDIKTITKCDIKLALAPRTEIEAALNAYLDKGETAIDSIIDETEDDSDVEILTKSENIDVNEVAQESHAAPIIKMVDLIIAEAIKRDASDIHIEPQETALRIRYRIDGELHQIFDLPKRNQNAIITRLKIMSTLDITETRIPQDGRFRVRIENKEIDFRVSILPVNFGGKIVLRALLMVLSARAFLDTDPAAKISVLALVKSCKVLFSCFI